MSNQGFTSDKEPTRLALSFYDELEGEEDELKITMLFNAICLFSAASNINKVEFDYNEQHIELERREMEAWYGRILDNELTEYAITKRIEQLVAAGQELPF
ncbi:hypothetical protein [Paenibacillus sp. FSL W7-1287]|uniref:hypothetical protein n=1 Tax=Paenibacillus sp. FSL W7-1287 TaxID=2954538 RepID=UPI0030F4FC05